MCELVNRQAVVSGRFYPSDPSELSKNLSNYFNEAIKPHSQKHVQAVISPHAGYVFSGTVAAGAFANISSDYKYKNIFILAPSHHVSINGASIYNIGNYETPLGEAKINIDLANELIEQHLFFSYYPNAHIHEHSLEVQLPFIQYWLKPGYKIVPIIIGTQDLSVIEKMASALKPYFTNDNLFVISSDFSHFPNYADAYTADKITEEAILSKSVKQLKKGVEKNKKAGFPNLATSACGIAGIYCLLYLIQNKPEFIINKIMYQNSGDSAYGDHDRVVGYLSFTVHADTPDENSINFTDKQKKTLLKIARDAIKNKLLKQPYELSIKDFDAELTKNYGLFVSLHKKKELRGCVGRFESDEPIYDLVKKMARSAAFNDSRFSPVHEAELNDIEIEISVLSPLKRINNKDDIVIGTHGIFIKQGFQRGTLLPQVAVNNGWNVDDFLSYCSKHKAGIGWNGWKSAELYTYTADIFTD